MMGMGFDKACCDAKMQMPTISITIELGMPLMPECEKQKGSMIERDHEYGPAPKPEHRMPEPPEKAENAERPEGHGFGGDSKEDDKNKECYNGAVR